MDVAALLDAAAGLSATLVDGGRLSWALGVVLVLAAADSLVPVVPSELLVASLVAVSTSAGRPAASLAVLAASATGTFLGDSAAFALGRGACRCRWGAILLERADGAARAMRGHAPTAVLTGRFVPGLRVAVALAAGASGLPWRRFLALDVASVLLWCAVHGPLSAAAGMLLPGRPWAAGAAGAGAGIAVGLAVEAAGRIRRARERRRTGASVREAVGAGTVEDEEVAVGVPQDGLAAPGLVLRS